MNMDREMNRDFTRWWNEYGQEMADGEYQDDPFMMARSAFREGWMRSAMGPKERYLFDQEFRAGGREG
jgi:hypothetical protein